MIFKSFKFKNIIYIVIISAFIASGCSQKKEEQKNQMNNQSSQQVQEQASQNQSTQNIQKQNSNDTMKPKTDTAEVKKDNDTKTSNIVVIKTNMGDIEVELFEKDAPNHVENFKKLVKSGFYNGTTFHRVIQGFMIQGGDPNSKDNDKSNDGQGGPGYTIPAEIKAKHEKGSLAAARLGDAINPKRESSGSQFYIVTGEASHLDGQYTVFGKVIKGLDVALKIEKVKKDANDNPIDKVVIEKMSFK
jgi:cyclophilin family peptidyl-prolyl cis-trans isomerase